MSESSVETVPNGLAPTVRIALPEPKSAAERAPEWEGSAARYRRAA